MPYRLEDFGEIYKEDERPDIDLSQGRKVTDLLPEKTRRMLADPGGSSHGGDFSRQDSAVITSILTAGFTAGDAYVTFVSSARGRHAAERKSGHFDDYVQRTIQKAVSFHSKNGHVEKSETVSVDFGKRHKTPEGEGIITMKASEIETEKTHWVWKDYIPSGKITILAGDPGMGKSTIALDLLSRISCGTVLPSGGRSISGTCIIASAEDAAEDTITPRLIVARANLGRIEIVKEVRIEDELRYLTFPRDLERLKQVIVKKGVRIFVIDPLNAFLEKGTDTYKDQDVRSVLGPMEAIAEETGAAILIIAHLNKKEDSSTLYRVGGSIGFIGAARSVLAVTTAQTKNATKVLYSLKSNLSKKPPALAYETRAAKREREGTEWLGESKISSSLIRWKGEVDFDPSKGSVTEADKAENEAEDFLRQVLTDGAEVSAETIYAEAKLAGIARAQLIRTKSDLGIQLKKKRDGKWYWKWED